MPTMRKHKNKKKIKNTHRKSYSDLKALNGILKSCWVCTAMFINKGMYVLFRDLECMAKQYTKRLYPDKKAFSVAIKQFKEKYSDILECVDMPFDDVKSIHAHFSPHGCDDSSILCKINYRRFDANVLFGSLTNCVLGGTKEIKCWDVMILYLCKRLMAEYELNKNIKIRKLHTNVYKILNIHNNFFTQSMDGVFDLHNT